MLTSKSKKRRCPACMTFPQRLIFPQNIIKLSSRPCSRTMSKSCAQANCPKASKSLLNPEEVQGSTILKPLIKSGHRLPITSIGCRDPSTLTPPDPETLHPPDLHCVVTNLVIAEVKMCDGFVDAQGIGQDLEEM